MATERAAIIGRVVADFVRDEMKSARGTAFIRLQHFDRDEISVVVALLRDFRLRASSPAVQIVVGTRHPWEGLPPGVALAPEDTLTKYRNNNHHGLVIIEDEPQNDAQGLRNMRVISDREVLGAADPDGRDVHRGRRKQLLSEAWGRCAPSGATLPPPDALLRQTDLVFGAIARAASLRRWVDFLVAVCKPLAAAGAAVDAGTCATQVGASLHHLDLFRDEPLFDGSEAERRRRLARNVAFAKMQNASGRDVATEELARRIEATSFRGADGQILPPEVNQRLRAAARMIVDPASPRDFGSMSYDEWAQIFANEAKKAGLGATIKRKIEERDRDRVAEFEGLDVEAGLDQDDADAAETLLKASGEPPLVALLPEALQRRVEKVASPSGRSAPDPLRELLKLLQTARDDGALLDGSLVQVQVEPVDGAASRTSVPLFRLIYGPTLEDVVQRSRDGLGWHLEVKGLGAARIDFPEERPADDDDAAEFDPRDLWSALRVIVRGTPPGGRARDLGRFEWRPLEHPGLVALARLLHAPEHHRFEPDVVLDDWLRTSFTSPLPGAKELVPMRPDATPDTPLGRWLQTRRDALADLAKGGLRADALGDYVRVWGQLLAEVRATRVPAGAPDPELASFVAVDSIALPDGHFALCATHPLRMRWLERHFVRVAEKLAVVLERGLSLNGVNRDLFFDRIEQLSPHQHPPFVCLDGSTLAVATREVDGHEEFAAIRRRRAPARDWLSSVDDASVEEMAGVVRSYVDAYPHKRDGLSVVVFLRDGDTRVVERLISRVRQRDYADLSLEVHVFAAPEYHHAIAQALAGFDSEEERGASLMPGVQSVLHGWLDLESPPDTSGLKNRIDLAIVPNLFGTTAFAQEKTRPENVGKGSFDPWMDRTTYADATPLVASNENVSRVLLPRRPDPLLETWSTLSVWNIRNEPVGMVTASSVDYFTIQVRFDMSRDFFAELHRVAHWVVTLDPFIGREQIEALQNQPDIITVRPGVGKNEAYTLIVSSSSGREFVERKLSRKLLRDLRIVETEARADAVAKLLYRRSRHLAPGVLLRALGLGQTVQEIIGLLVARHALEEFEPQPEALRFEAWVSLDEHTDWFGGPQSVRADLLRLRGRRVEGRLVLEAHVLESKFREREEVSRAELQVQRTISLVSSALASGEDAATDDGEFWRRELVRAVEQGCKRPERGDDYAALRVWREDGSLGAEMAAQDRNDLFAGEYTLAPVTGTVCSITYGIDDPGEPVVRRSKDLVVIRVGGREIRRILGLLAATPSPQARATSNVSAPASATMPGTSATLAATDSTSPTPIDAVVALPTPAPPPPAAPSASIPGARSAPASGPPSASAASRGGLGRDGLEARYQLVLDAFAEFGVRVRRSDSESTAEGPGFYIVRVVPERGVSPDVVMGRTAELKLKLGLSAEQTPRTYIDRGAIVFEIPKHDADRYPVFAEDIWQRCVWPTDRLFAALGEDVAGNVVGLEFSSSDSPHLLVAGATGSGKSVALESLLQGLARAYPPAALEFVMVDPKGTELIDFENDPHLRGPLGQYAEDARSSLEEAVGEMQRRYELFKAKRVRDLPGYNAVASDRIPWRVIVLDEYADLTSDKDDRKFIEDQLKRLAQKARACGIHVIVATQKPSAVVLNTTIRSNLPAQLALRVKSATDSRMIMDEAGAETLAGKGDAFLRTAKSIVRIQCAMRRPPTR